ncbi:hypothetical protein A4X17_09750 [Plantibacter sp. H53]|uniref:ABC transporter ATP-binding protein n=1 Tax=Plantibacter sp. H53 TaxID=1827323 RepID=UPI0007DA41E0|nr:ABC transporter ATP-binding protein [Plantibacter sp. H53]OAN26852.1 hypothetical protein A4X17_09750 [Plantibacter sp. H53]
MTDNILRIEGLRVQRRSFAVDDVSFAVERGTVTGLVGPNGAGKTTTIRALLGLLTPDAGDIEVLGRPAGSPSALARIGVVLDQPTAAPEWRVASIGRRLSPFYPAWDQQRFEGLLDRLGVPREQRVSELSRGQGVKLSLSTALAQQPELLILDEPSSGLDPASRREIGDLIREFMVDPEHAVLFSTHITTDLDELADDLLVLVNGRVAYDGRFADTVDEFAMVRGAGAPPTGEVLGLERRGEQWSALIRTTQMAEFGPETVIDPASVDDIVIHLAAAHGKASA